jgi:ABC-type antimicrobial peptide transport system permease subunit
LVAQGTSCGFVYGKPHTRRWLALRSGKSGSAPVVGLGAALLLTRFVGSILFGLKPIDPLTLASAALLLFAVAMLAGWGPARRASSIQPVQALRHE